MELPNVCTCSFVPSQALIRLHSASGLLMTYLALCPTSDCAEPRNLTWYLLDSAGKSDDNLSWYIYGYTLPNTPGYAVTLPQNLPGGTYLFRHEVGFSQLRRIIWLIGSSGHCTRNQSEPGILSLLRPHSSQWKPDHGVLEHEQRDNIQHRPSPRLFQIRYCSARGIRMSTLFSIGLPLTEPVLRRRTLVVPSPPSQDHRYTSKSTKVTEGFLRSRLL